MMRILLRCIANNPGQSSLELSECLADNGYQVDRSLIQIAIRELEQKGFLRRERQVACASADTRIHTSSCAHCPQHCSDIQATTWVLTEKARSAAGT